MNGLLSGEINEAATITRLMSKSVMDENSFNQKQQVCKNNTFLSICFIFRLLLEGSYRSGLMHTFLCILRPYCIFLFFQIVPKLETLQNARTNMDVDIPAFSLNLLTIQLMTPLYKFFEA